MNIENPYSPFTSNSLSTQLYDFQNLLALMHLNSFSSYYNEPVQPMSSSLNQKRCFPLHRTEEFDDFEYDPYMVQKKLKPDLGVYNQNMFQYSDLNTGNDFTLKPKFQANQSSVIAVDDDQDCFIVEKSSSGSEKFHSQQNNQFNYLNVLEKQYEHIRKCQAFDSDLKGINNYHNHINASQMLMPSRSSNPAEVIVIDNDDDDDYTSLDINKQSFEKHTVLQNNSPHSTLASEYNSTVNLQDADIPQSFAEKHRIVHPRAVVPPFELSSRKPQKKRRTVKSTWNPEICGDQTFQRWLGGIERMVGIEVTNEEKVIKVMKAFDMNIDNALRNIRRNKAHFKNYFRVQKLEKDRTSS